MSRAASALGLLLLLGAPLQAARSARVELAGLFAPQVAPAADQPDTAQPGDTGLPPTRLANVVLAGRPLLVRTRVISTRPAGMGTVVLRLLIEERLLGEGAEQGSEVVVFAFRGHFLVGGRDLLALEPFGRSGRFRVGQRVDGRDPNHRDKLAMIRRQIVLLQTADQEAQVAATFDLLLASLVSPIEWTRRYGLRELRWLAAVHPEVLTSERCRRLQLVGHGSPWPAVQRGVESVAILLADRGKALRDAPEQESSQP
jgi:hypothetical protein